jgi:N-acetylmuramoyl-L-alanine amidase
VTPGLLLALLAAAPAAPAPGAPMTVLVSTARGDARVPVRTDPLSGPVVAAQALVSVLGGRLAVDGAWAEVEVARQPFRFLIGAPVYAIGRQVKPLAGTALVRRDTLFLPIQFVTHVLPTELKERFRYEATGGRLVELTGRAPAPVAAAAARDPDRLPNGLRRGRVVTIDPGHGGTDPGNPGLHFPRGVREKDVTLQMGLLVREELLKRGVGVIMTRTTDTLISLRHRGGYCRDRCDLFVSLHVNSLPRRPGFTSVRGFETYYLDAAKTEDAARVARMENEAVRFEEAVAEPGVARGLDFILKDLQVNEHLRESVRLAELVQSHAAEVHTGPDKGVKPAPFTVLATAQRPAVLFEMGFSTNPTDARLLTEPRSQRNLAASIADAIVAYLLEYERRVGVAAPAAGAGSE